MDLAPISKAVAGGLVSAVAALLARYGFHPGVETVNALHVIVTAVVGYALGHVVVFFAPANKPKQ